MARQPAPVQGAIRSGTISTGSPLRPYRLGQERTLQLVMSEEVLPKEMPLKA